MIIGICDDDEIIREKIKQNCLDTIGKYDNEILLKEFSDGEEIFKEKTIPDILILDIEMKNMDGIAVKNRLQNKQETAFIIFVSSHDEMMADAYGLNVIGFVTKKYMDAQLPKILEVALQLTTKAVIIDGNINSHDIVYVSSEHVYNNLHLKNGDTKLVRISSRELESQLERADFVRVHREYLVNLEYVEDITEKTISVKGNNIPISTRLYADVKKKYLTYFKKNARYC